MKRRIYNEVYDFGATAYLAGASALVELADSTEMIGDSRVVVSSGKQPKNNKKLSVEFVKRGQNDRQAVEVLDKIYGSSHLGANVSFNAKAGYGDGIMVVKKVRNEAGDIVLQEQLPSEQPEIFQFLEENNYTNSVQEWAMDQTVFYESYAEYILNRDKAKRKIVRLNPVETINSRISKANADGRTEWHGYSLGWNNDETDDLEVNSLIDRRTPLLDLKVKLGLMPDMKGQTKWDGNYKYVHQLLQPTPGNYYYGKPYWWAIFTGGWYDFACAIPKFKKALLKNQMTIKYHIKISSSFFPNLFKAEGIDPNNKEVTTARKKKFYTQMNDFLANEDNAGQSFVSNFEYDKIKGNEINDIKIEAMENNFKGGEYLEDSSEVTNVMGYAMELPTSLIGATGKNGNINGTEARELFIIKQAMMKPIRDLLVSPLYVVKAINGWDPDVHFYIPNIMLTTLDKNTGAEKQIGNQKV